MQRFRCLPYAQTTQKPGEPEAKNVSPSRASFALRGCWDCRITNSGSRKILPLNQFDIRNPQRPLYTPWLAPVPPAGKHLSVPGFSMCFPALPREFGIGRAIPLSPSVQKEPPACRSPKGRVNFADGGQPVPNHGAIVSHTMPRWQGTFTYHRGCRVLFPSLGAVVPSTGAWDDSLHT